MPDSSSVRLEQLIVYPVKSLGGISVDHWPVTEQGLAYDRHWMLVMPNGRFVTQRQLPQMALISTAIENGNLILSSDGSGSVTVPLLSGSGDTITAQVWRDECDVQEASEAASRWLTEALRPPHPLRLVRMAPQTERPQSQPERFGPDTRVQFSDAAPFLIANQASLEALNELLVTKGHCHRDMRRFRPNIVISGWDAFEEHRHSNLEVNGVSFQLIDHCERCIITTIDQDTAQKDANMETYRELATLNSMPGKPDAPAFGVNATLTAHTEPPTHLAISPWPSHR